MRVVVDQPVRVRWALAYRILGITPEDTMPSVTGFRNTLTVSRGATHEFRFTFTTDDGGYFDLTGKVVYFIIGTANPKTRVVSLRSDQVGQMTLANPRNGIVEITLAAADSAKLSLREYDYEEWIVDGADRLQAVRGRVHVQDTVMP